MLCAQSKILFADHISNLVDLRSVYEEPEDKSNKRLISFFSLWLQYVDILLYVI
jgi:hypothetical protein